MRELWRALRCPQAPWFSALVLLALVLVFFATRCYYESDGPPLGLVKTVEPLKYYDPDFLYEIPQKQTWVQTGEVAGVPIIEPADEETRRLVKTALGDESDKVDFLYVGEVGSLRHGADLFFVQDEIEPDTAVEIGELPRGVARDDGKPFPVGPPPRLILRAREPPRMWVEEEHAVEFGAGFDTRFAGQIEYVARYRPGKLWVRDWFYLTADAGAGYRNGEVDARAHVWLGKTLAGRD